MRHILAICLSIFTIFFFTYAVEASTETVEASTQLVEASSEIVDASVEEVETTETIPVMVETAEAVKTADKLLETADQLLGVRYKTAGSSPTSGFDCSGFTTYVFTQHNISLPRSSSDMYTVGREVSRSELQPGDLVFFKTSGNGISHVGIYTGDNMFIHSSSSVGVTKTDLNDPYYWSSRYVGAKRVLPAEVTNS